MTGAISWPPDSAPSDGILNLIRGSQSAVSGLVECCSIGEACKTINVVGIVHKNKLNIYIYI